MILAAKPEVLIVGTGYYGALRVLPETQNHLIKAEIELIVEKTMEACQMYNAIAATKQRIAAALHLTC